MEYKKMLPKILLVASLSVCAFSSTIDDMQQKTSKILVKKVFLLEQEVKSLKSINKRLEDSINKIGIILKSEGYNLNDINASAVRTSNFQNTKKKEYDFKNLYKFTRGCRAYKTSILSQYAGKYFKKNSYALILQRTNKASLTHNGVWVNNNCLSKIDVKKMKDGEFYKVSTYMANSREKPGVNSEIVSVFMKNDMLYIVSSKKAQDGGVWYKIENDGYINKRIVKPLDTTKK